MVRNDALETAHRDTVRVVEALGTLKAKALLPAKVGAYERGKDELADVRHGTPHGED